MAGHGFPPKPASERRHRHAPTRGEWVDLEPLGRPILPRYRASWQVSREMWAAWRADPVSSQYGPADVAAIIYLAERFEDLSDPSRWAALDRLGLTPRGKRDLRWRTPAEVKTIAEQPPVKRLRLMEKEGRDGAAA